MTVHTHSSEGLRKIPSQIVASKMISFVVVYITQPHQHLASHHPGSARGGKGGTRSKSEKGQMHSE